MAYTETDFTRDINAAAQHRRSADLLITEAASQLAMAKAVERKGRAAGASMREAFVAALESDWGRAPAVRESSERIGKAWAAQPRNGSSFFLDEPLHERSLVSATPAGAGYLVDTAHELRVQEAHDTAGAIFSLMTVTTTQEAAGNQLVAKLETLPTTYVLANETTSITDYTPTATQTILSPKNVTSFGQMSRRFILDTPNGAEAAARLHVNAVKGRALQQILEGTGSNGQLTGLTVNSDVPTAVGTSIDAAKIATAMESVEKTGSGPFAWIVSAGSAKLLRQRAVISGGAGILADNRIGGYPCYVTGCTTSAIAVFGSWSDLQVFQWRPLELGVDPYGVAGGYQFQSGIVSLRAWLALDAAPLLSKSFYTLTAIT